MKYLINSVRIIFIGISIFLSLEGKCQIVYEDNTFPDIKIYEVSADIFADVVVYKAPNSIFSGIKNNTGIWFFTDNPSADNIKVGYVTASIFTDLKVYSTTSNIFSQWRNDEKRRWFASKLHNYNLTSYDFTKYDLSDMFVSTYVY